jgi:two-component system, cell cycle sensor histidine kinase and response regulator CckA
MPVKARLKIAAKQAATPGRQLSIVVPAKRIEEDANNLAAIGRLVGSVAHDFNNLLTGIMLCSELLAAGVAADERLLRQVRAIQTAGQHGADLVRQLMSVARPRAERAMRICPNHVIAGMTGLLSRLVGENIVLDTILAPDSGQVEMASTHILQIVLNVVINARDAIPAGGRITVGTRNVKGGDGSWVEISVRDTGAGMDRETQARLFQPYFTTKQFRGGYGLGLSTAYGIVEQGGGNIEVESQPGCGATFRVLLPRLKDVQQ